MRTRPFFQVSSHIRSLATASPKARPNGFNGFNNNNNNSNGNINGRNGTNGSSSSVVCPPGNGVTSGSVQGSNVRSCLYGVWAPALTPVMAINSSARGRAFAPDSDRFVAHVERLMLNGCHGVVVLGTTGEAAAFSTAQRRALLEDVAKARLLPQHIIVGISAATEEESAELAAHAVSLGYPNVLLLPPSQCIRGGSGSSGNGSLSLTSSSYSCYARAVERSVRLAGPSLGVILHSWPPGHGAALAVDEVQRLREAFPGNIIGIKESSGDWERTRLLIEAFSRSGLAVFSGAESVMVRALKAGGAGSITALANVFPIPLRQVYARYASDIDGKQEQRILDLCGIVRSVPMIAGMKEILSSACSDPAWRTVMPPLSPLTDEQRLALYKAVGPTPVVECTPASAIPANYY